MAHDVFISHAHKDKNFANALCEKLESSQVKCWIAGRDISAGDDWTEAIRNAIGSSRLIVLVLSESANAAIHIEREIAHAYYAKRTILPVRLTQTPPKRELLFYLGNVPWFDVFNGPVEQHIGDLIQSVNGMVQGGTLARDAMPSYRASAGTREGLYYQDSWFGTLQASHYRSLGMLKGVSIVVFLFCAIGLLWYVYSQWEGERFSLLGMKSRPAASPDSAHRAESSSTPAYTFSRFGFTPSPSPAPSAQEVSGAAPSPVVGVGSASASPRTISNQPAPVVAVAASPTREVDPSAESVREKLARFNPTPSATPQRQSTPSVESVEAQVQNNSTSAPQEESLKKLVQDYMRTMAGDDNAAQERFFSWRVNFYGKGLLSLAAVRALMERYRRDWPVQNWTPRGEPEFPRGLHSTHPELYEVLQPFDWTLSNGSEHKQGSATLYVRIRKDDNGQLHIIYLRSSSSRGPR
jgi:hypothetical protein